ncbi:hypothetical protein AVEN_171664-1 [Araneus ventricosus]|uniref:Uncharacterized protein n=1 Tax=Araneus ventricosus TaxID=182803 RepID=A0A4Y2I6Y0_ARAVE|nr:hypothetical protein AVEN_171664-1 [Araneus ventricosus]
MARTNELSRHSPNFPPTPTNDGQFVLGLWRHIYRNFEGKDDGFEFLETVENRLGPMKVIEIVLYKYAVYIRRVHGELKGGVRESFRTLGVVSVRLDFIL